MAALEPERLLSQFELRRWSLDDGLPQSSIAALAQTPDGYLWVGTLVGVASFDGVEFRLREDLPREPIVGLATDTSGSLWVATADRVLVVGFSWVREVLLDGRPVSGAYTLVTRSAGGVWIARSEAPLLVAEVDGARPFLDAEGRGIDGVRSVADRQRRVCMARVDEVWCVRDGNLEVVLSRGGGEDVGAPIETLLLAADGSLWIGTLGAGLVQVVGGGIRRRIGATQGLEEGVVVSMLQDRDGSIWFSDGTAGIARLVGDDLQRSGAIRLVRSLFEDREGNLWLGSNAEGLGRLSERPIVTFSVQEGLPVAVVHSVLSTTDGSIWIGTEGGGLAQIRGGRIVGRFAREDGLPSLDVMALAATAAGELLVGTAGGVVRRSGSGFTALPTDGSPQNFSLLEDSSGRLWGGFLGEPRRFDDGRFRSLGLVGDRYVAAIAETTDGTVWLGGAGFLMRFDGARPEEVELPDTLRGGMFLALLADGDELWLGTLGSGLALRRADGSVGVIDRGRGLCDDDVFALVDDGRGRLWMSSNMGVFVVVEAEVRSVLDGAASQVRCRRFGRAHGMRQHEASGGTQPSGWLDTEGLLWFATIDGVVRVDPGRLLEEPVRPVAIVERVGARDHALEAPGLGLASDLLVLPPDVRQLEVRYTAIHLSAPERLAFRYRLLGLDEDWSEAGARRSASYSGLGPEEYRFEVQARLADGAWGPADAVAITVQPRIFETLWFRSLAFLAALLALYLLHRLLLRSVRLRQQELESAVQRRTTDLELARAELAEANETLAQRVEDGIRALRDADRMAAYGHLVAGVAHELRHPLFAIQTAAHLLDSRLSSRQEVRRELDLLAGESRRIELLLEDLLELARPQAPILVPIDPGDLVADVVATFEAGLREDEQALPVRVAVEDALPRIAAEREKLLRMLVNLLNNARRHAGATHVALAAVAIDDPMQGPCVRFSVADDGVGIAAPRLATLFEPFVSFGGGTGLGLTIAKRIAESHRGSIRVDSVVGRGTTFIVTLPILADGSD